MLAAHAAKQIDVTVIRPGDVWGPGSVWVRSPLAELQKPTGLPLPNGGNGIFSPVCIDNFVDGLVLSLADDAAIGQVFIISDGVGVRCADFFGRMAAACDGTIRTLPMTIAAPTAQVLGKLLRRFGQDTDLSAGTMGLLNRPGTYAIGKARKVLGYRPLVSIDEGMQRVENGPAQKESSDTGLRPTSHTGREPSATGPRAPHRRPPPDTQDDRVPPHRNPGWTPSGGICAIA